MTENWRRGFAAAEAEVEAATCLLETLAAAWRKAMRAAIGDIFWRGDFILFYFYWVWVVMMMMMMSKRDSVERNGKSRYDMI